MVWQEVTTPENFICRYENSQDEEIRKLVEYVKRTNSLDVFNYAYKEKYDDIDIAVFYDEEAQMNYIYYQEKKMYFPNTFSIDGIIAYVSSILAEQDEESPHCYYQENYLVQEGDVVIDAGVAEGNFALSVIDKVKKIYLIECEEDWVRALEKTFEPYKDKVVIVERFVSDTVDDTNITIDELLQGEEVNYIKMDIEGAERAALTGAKKSIENSPKLTIAACAYHKRGDEAWIKEYLESLGMKTENTPGYMWFCLDLQARLALELRRGLVFGKK